MSRVPDVVECAPAAVAIRRLPSRPLTASPARPCRHSVTRPGRPMRHSAGNSRDDATSSLLRRGRPGPYGAAAPAPGITGRQELAQTGHLVTRELRERDTPHTQVVSECLPGARILPPGPILPVISRGRVAAVTARSPGVHGARSVLLGRGRGRSRWGSVSCSLKLQVSECQSNLLTAGARRSGEVGGDHVARGPAGSLPLAVVPAGGARVGVPHDLLQVAERPAGVEVQRRERVPHRLRGRGGGAAAGPDSCGRTGAAAHRAPARAVSPVETSSIWSQRGPAAVHAASMASATPAVPRAARGRCTPGGTAPAVLARWPTAEHSSRVRPTQKRAASARAASAVIR